MPSETVRRGNVRPATAATPVAAYTPSGTAGVTYIVIRDVTLVNVTPGEVKVTVGIHTSAADSPERRLISSEYAIAAGGEPVSIMGGIMGLATTEIVYAMTDVANSVNVAVTAVEVNPT